MKFSLPIQRPANSQKVTCKVSGAYVFLYTTNKGEPAARGFTKSAKSNSVFWLRFPSEARRAAFVTQFFANQSARTEATKARRAERATPHTLQVGHVLYTSWGYEQTNVDFYQVTRIVGKNSVEIRAIASQDATGAGRGTHDSGRCLPVLDAFKGEPMIKRVDMGGKSPSIRIASYASAQLWDGKSVYYSWGY